MRGRSAGDRRGSSSGPSCSGQGRSECSRPTCSGWPASRSGPLPEARAPTAAPRSSPSPARAMSPRRDAPSRRSAKRLAASTSSSRRPATPRSWPTASACSAATALRACSGSTPGRGPSSSTARMIGVDAILENRVLFGSVNASRQDWLAAVEALDRARAALAGSPRSVRRPARPARPLQRGVRLPRREGDARAVRGLIRHRSHVARTTVSRAIRESVKTSSSSVLVVENSETTAPSSPAWNQWSVFGGIVC